MNRKKNFSQVKTQSNSSASKSSPFSSAIIETGKHIRPECGQKNTKGKSEFLSGEVWMMKPEKHLWILPMFLETKCRKFGIEIVKIIANIFEKPHRKLEYFGGRRSSWILWNKFLNWKFVQFFQCFYLKLFIFRSTWSWSFLVNQN